MSTSIPGNLAEAALPDIDYLGAQGGSLALAFAAGCAACWAFIKAFVTGPINKSYEKRIASLEEQNDRCEARTLQLETLLFFHGPGNLRQAMQSALSEERIERIKQEGAGE